MVNFVHIIPMATSNQKEITLKERELDRGKDTMKMEKGKLVGVHFHTDIFFV